MKAITLYNTDDYSSIFNTALAEEIRWNIINNNPDEELDDETLDRMVDDDLEELSAEDFEEACENIQPSLKSNFLMREVNNRIEYPFMMNKYADFKDEFRNCMLDLHRHSVINNERIGVDENGTLFVSIHSGNSLYSNKLEIKNLTPLGDRIFESYINSDDSRDEENYGAFNSLHKAFGGYFGEQDFFEALWNNPKYTQQVKVANVKYDGVEFTNEKFKAKKSDIANFCKEIIAELQNQQNDENNIQKTRRQR